MKDIAAFRKYLMKLKAYYQGQQKHMELNLEANWKIDLLDKLIKKIDDKVKQ